MQVPFFVAEERITITIDPEEPKYYEFQVKLKETRTETNDGSCMNYPSSAHQSYTGCLDKKTQGNSCSHSWLHDSKDVRREPVYWSLNKVA